VNQLLILFKYLKSLKNYIKLVVGKTLEEIEREIYSLFAEVARALGYSEIHGKIIAALLVKGGEASLQELAKSTKYSPSMISLSLDLLEFFEVIKKVKHTGDRKLYVKLQGSLLDSLKRAFIIKLQKNVENSLAKFEEYKRELRKSKEKDAKKVMKTLEILENELKRLKKFLNIAMNIKF